jgi:hypothetical protein
MSQISTSNFNRLQTTNGKSVRGCDKDSSPRHSDRNASHPLTMSTQPG